VVLLADPFLDGLLVRDAPLGYSTLLGARFYGYANPAFAIMATACLFALVPLAGWAWYRPQKIWAALLVGIMAVVVLVVDGAPWLGADLGGGVTAAAAFLVAALVVAGGSLGWRRGLAAGLSALAVGIALTVVDYLRGPEQWTHLGAFANSVLQGGAWEIILRKAAMWARLSIGPLCAFAVVWLLVVIARRRGALTPLSLPAWRDQALGRAGAIALGVLLIGGSLVNDSGLVVAASGAALAAPLAVSALIQTARIGARELGAEPVQEGVPAVDSS
jgi:hypothetical protein